MDSRINIPLQFIELKKAKNLDMPRVRENGSTLISLFFKLYAYYIDTFNILRENIWNLDEGGFKIGETIQNIKILVCNGLLMLFLMTLRSW